MNLRDARKEMGYTQSELGGLVGVTQQQIAKYEAGQSTPSKRVIALLSRHLDLTPYEAWEMFFSDSPSAEDEPGGDAL